MRRMLLGVLTFLVAGCGSDEFPSGTGPGVSTVPDSSIVFQSQTLVACPGGCCVRTRLVNTNDRPVDLTIQWNAFNAQGQSIGSVLDFITDVGAGATNVSTSQPFGNPGGNPITTCSQIARFERGTVLVIAE